MIQPLRKIHRETFFALLLILPALFASGLLSRHKPLGGRTHVQITGNKTVSERTVLLGGQAFRVRIVREQNGKSGWALELIPQSPLLTPDALVYWSKTDATPEFPSGAMLLGAIEPAKPYHIPPQEMQAGGQGFIVLYSLAQKQTLGSFAIGPVGGWQ